MFDIISFFWNLFSGLTAGILAAIAFIKWYGAKWFDTRFTKVIEAFRHEHAKELAYLNAEIDGSLNKRIRVQEKEFELAQEIWTSVTEAQSKLLHSISPIQQYSDLRRMDDFAREEYLGNFDLQDWQKREILEASDVQQEFARMVDRRRYSDAANAHFLFEMKRISSSIFWSKEVSDLLNDISKGMNDALIAKEISLDPASDGYGRGAVNKYNDEARPKVEKLGDILRQIIQENVSISATSGSS